LKPIVEENGESVERSSSPQALLVNESVKPLVPKRRVTIVDYYTNGAGDLSTTVGMGSGFCCFRGCIISVCMALVFRDNS